MGRVGKWKWQLLLCILGLGWLAVIAGSSAAALVDTYPEQLQVTSDPDEAADLKPSSSAVVQAAAPVDPDAEQHLVAEVYEVAEIQPSSSAVVQVSAPQPLASTGKPAALQMDSDSTQQPFAELGETTDLPAALSGGMLAVPYVEADQERQQLVAEPSDTTDARPTSNSAEVPIRQSSSVQQATATTPSSEDAEKQTTAVNQQSEPTPKGSGGDTEQTEYTWEDGDRTLTVILQSDLAIDEGASAKGAMADAPGGAIVKSEGSRSEGNEKSLPVFKSQSGALMTLPGGILLVLDPDWSQAEVNAFFSSNSIKLSKVEALGYIDNGYFIETEPGFPSLDLANSVAAQEGVMVSSPNWWTEVTVK